MQEFKRLITSNITNIWRYGSFYPPVAEQFRLTAGEGGTLLQNIEGIYLKREDENPTGSVKDRGLAFQISDAYQKGAKHLVLSSSGNAAISAALYCSLANIKLSVFVSPRINKNKLKKLKNLKIDLHIVKKPVRDAALFRKKYNIRNLRASINPAAIPGYSSLGFEIFENIKLPYSLFLPVSSGTTFVGVSRAFLKLKKLGLIKTIPQLHAVQTVYINPIASKFHKEFTPYQTTKGSCDTGLAGAICAPKTARKKEVLELIDESDGFGWIITDEEIQNSLNWLKDRRVDTSAEGAAALAAVFKAKKTKDIKTPICVLTGRKY